MWLKLPQYFGEFSGFGMFEFHDKLAQSKILLLSKRMTKDIDMEHLKTKKHFLSEESDNQDIFLLPQMFEYMVLGVLLQTLLQGQTVTC